MNSGESSILTICGEEYRIVESLTNLPAVRTWLCDSSGRRMHLRMMTGSCADDVIERAQKVREVASGSGLVVPLETGEQDGQVYALRAWVDAEPFDAFAKRFRFSPKRQEHALNIGVKLCRTVEGLHDVGLAHGDLKNSNVFFEKDGSPVVTDPVLADDAAKKTDPGEDVHALGLLLCRLYTGKPELVINVYTLMMLAKAKVPRQLLRVLWQAIHEDPGMRFQDAATMGRALREVPLPEYQRTVHVRALPDNAGPSSGLPTWLRNTAIFVGVVGLIAVASWFLGKGEIPTTNSSAQAAGNTSIPQRVEDFWKLSVPGAVPIRMRHLPAFETMLGDDSEPNSSRRMVRVDQPFSIATTEVTRGQFAAFVTATGYRTTAETAGGDQNRQVWVVESDRIRPRPDYNWRQPGYAQGDDHPVTSISWYDAKAFCDWLAEETGQRVRLPSESEWEYAARAGSASKYWWGDDSAGARGRENIMDQSVKVIFPSRNTSPWDDEFPRTAPVGSFEGNPLGLYDMFGNVWEWTADDWNGNSNAKAFRGAGYSSWPPNSAAYRFGNTATIGANLRGFRIVVEDDKVASASARDTGRNDTERESILLRVQQLLENTEGGFTVPLWETDFADGEIASDEVLARSGKCNPLAGEGIRAEPGNSGSFLISFPQGRLEPGGSFVVSLDIEGPSWKEDSFMSLYLDAWMESNDTRIYEFRLLPSQQKLIVEEGDFDGGAFRSESILAEHEMVRKISSGERSFQFKFQPGQASLATVRGPVAEFTTPFVSRPRFILPSLSSNEKILVSSISISALLPETAYVYALQLPVQDRFLYKYNDGANRWVRDILNPLWEGPQGQRNSVFDPAFVGSQSTFPMYISSTGLASFVYLGSTENEQMYLRGEVNNWEIREEHRLRLVGNLE